MNVHSSTAAKPDPRDLIMDAALELFARRGYHGTAVPADHDYVSVRTPGDGYYIGLDRETALHSQTLLAWALNGEPLTPGHGAPVRLATPITYGIKQLKRIGTIEFTETYRGRTWTWIDHQLYSATHGYAWLTLEDGHPVFTRRFRRPV